MGAPVLLALAAMALLLGTAAPLRLGGGSGPADPRAVVTHGSARFTVLTGRLIRLEYDPAGRFIDAQTTTVLNRLLPVVPFSAHVAGTELTIKTGSITLSYNATSGAACGAVTAGVDVTKAVRTAQHPNRIPNTTLAGCCALCTTDPGCTAYLFDTQTGTAHASPDSAAPPPGSCWLLSSFEATTPRPVRTLGILDHGFTPSNLRAEVALPNGSTTQWRFGDSAGNLGGTISSWNEINPEKLTVQPGLLSRRHAVVVDDSGRAQLNPAVKFRGEFPWIRPSARRTTDQYLLGYGTDYPAALRDFASISGHIPLIPRSVLGIWWSHYEPYTEDSFKSKVLAGFVNHSLPLNRINFDVNWHYNPATPQCNGYNGYDWNATAFPDVAAFLATLKAGYQSLPGVKIALNTHTFLGVDSCNACYDKVARAMGMDPSSKATVGTNITNLTFMQSLLDFCQRPNPVDGWWIDGTLGRWSAQNVSGAQSEAWMVAVHNSDQRAQGIRPLNLARYGVLGQHREAIGFSGDAQSSFTTLRAEINVSAMAANVMFGYWSHDVGGFKAPDPDAELYLRWMQASAVFPVFRIHGTRGSVRVPWAYSTFPEMKDEMLRRVMLSAYLYTAAWESTSSCVTMLRPLYYGFPLDDDAYRYPLEYLVGGHLLARPVDVPVGASGKAAVEVWIPPGTWYDLTTDRPVASGARQAQVPLAELPLYARAGAVIPLLPEGTRDVHDLSAVVWAVYPTGAGGETGVGSLYEDNTDVDDYESNHAETVVSTSFPAASTAEASATVTILPLNVTGSYKPAGTGRAHVVQLRGWPGADPHSVTVNGEALAKGAGTPGWSRTTAAAILTPSGTLEIRLGALPYTAHTVISIAG